MIKTSTIPNDTIRPSGPPLKPKNRRMVATVHQGTLPVPPQKPTPTPPKTPAEAASSAAPDWDGIDADFTAQKTLEEAVEPAPLDLAEEAQKEKLREAFYWGLCGVFHTVNWTGFRKLPVGKLKSLNLKEYGELGRNASNQLYDKLSAIEWLKKQLSRLEGIKKYIEEYKDILGFAVMMNLGVQAELQQRKKMADEAATTALNDNDIIEEEKTA